MNTVHNLVTGSNSGHEKRNPSPSSLVAPPTSESPHTPSLTPPNASSAGVPEVSLSLACSQRTSPESSNQGVGDDSGFISGFSSPATVLSTSKVDCCYKFFANLK